MDVTGLDEFTLTKLQKEANEEAKSLLEATLNGGVIDLQVVAPTLQNLEKNLSVENPLSKLEDFHEGLHPKQMELKFAETLYEIKVLDAQRRKGHLPDS